MDAADDNTVVDEEDEITSVDAEEQIQPTVVSPAIAEEDVPANPVVVSPAIVADNVSAKPAVEDNQFDKTFGDITVAKDVEETDEEFWERVLNTPSKNTLIMLCTIKMRLEVMAHDLAEEAKKVKELSAAKTQLQTHLDEDVSSKTQKTKKQRGEEEKRMVSLDKLLAEATNALANKTGVYYDKLSATLYELDVAISNGLFWFTKMREYHDCESVPLTDKQFIKYMYDALITNTLPGVASKWSKGKGHLWGKRDVIPVPYSGASKMPPLALIKVEDMKISNFVSGFHILVAMNCLMHAATELLVRMDTLKLPQVARKAALAKHEFASTFSPFQLVTRDGTKRLVSQYNDLMFSLCEAITFSSKMAMHADILKDKILTKHIDQYITVEAAKEYARLTES